MINYDDKYDENNIPDLIPHDYESDSDSYLDNNNHNVPHPLGLMHRNYVSDGKNFDDPNDENMEEAYTQNEADVEADDADVEKKEHDIQPR